MHQHLKRRYSYLAASLLGIVLHILQFSNILPVIGNCYPILPLPLVLICGAQFGAFPGALFGAVTGMAMDIYTGSSPSFHMLIFCFAGCISGLLITYYMNHNWQALSIITVLGCLLYYFIKWLVFYLTNDSFVSYFVTVGIPSAFYTALLSIPIYLLVARILRAVENSERR